MNAVYGNSSPSLKTTIYLFHEFKRGHTSVSDEERSGRPIEVTTEEKIHRIVLNDRRIKVREIVEMVGISDYAPNQYWCKIYAYKVIYKMK